MMPKTISYLLDLLASAYEAADWKRIAGRKRSSLDIFQHKVKAASAQQTVPRFTEKLCNSLGLQSIEVDPGVITVLDQHREEVLKTLRRESIYWVLLAEREAKEAKTR